MATVVHPHQGSEAIDSFLMIQTAKAGKIKGESRAKGHEDEIVVTGWQWGMSSSSALGSTQATGRRSYTALTITKQVDLATTGILKAAATNYEVKEAKLTLRRAGGDQVDFLKVTLKSARIVSVDHSGRTDGGMVETVGIAFTKVEVEYAAQQTTGFRGGAAIFTDELVSNA